MRRSILTAGAVLLLCGTAAIAQTNTPNTPPVTPTDNTPASNANPAGALRSHIHDMLQQSGFSDIRVMPSSFMIRARDKDGNPVVMSVSPDSVTEVSELRRPDSNSTPDSTTSAVPASGFVSVDQTDELSSNLVGLDVYNSSNQDVGQIKDIAMGPQGHARAYIVSVGGFLGLGEHYVAMNPASIKVSYNTSDQKWHATTGATKADVKSAAEFKYDGRWTASKS